MSLRKALHYLGVGLWAGGVLEMGGGRVVEMGGSEWSLGVKGRRERCLFKRERYLFKRRRYLFKRSCV